MTAALAGLADQARELALDLPEENRERARILSQIPGKSEQQLQMLIRGLRARKNSGAGVREGIYVYEGRHVYRVHRDPAGGMQAQWLGGNGWVDRPGAVASLEENRVRRAPLEDVIAFGFRDGRCGCCGERLDTVESMSAGIDPGCARRWFGVTPGRLRTVALRELGA